MSGMIGVMEWRVVNLLHFTIWVRPNVTFVGSGSGEVEKITTIIPYSSPTGFS